MTDNSSAKTPEFRKVMRGYDPAEVSAYIDSLKKELGEALRREQELDEKLSSVMTRYAEVQKKREELDAALADIDRERDAVMSDAHRRSADMLDDTRKRCAAAEREMREGISRQRDAFVSMHEMILSFRADLFEKYNAQIDSIDSIASLADAYDEAMMFCMQKNGVSAHREEYPPENPAAEPPTEDIPAPESPADEIPPEETDAQEYAIAENSAEIADLEIPDSPTTVPAVESFDYFAEDVSTDNTPVDNTPDDDADEDFYTDDAPAGDYSEDSEEDSFDSADDDFLPPTPEDGFTAQDYSFDEDNHPRRTDAERILSSETPAVTRDDLPEDFDIYHASGDQLLELIYGKGSAGSANSSSPADNTAPADDPLRGVDYSFGDDD